MEVTRPITVPEEPRASALLSSLETETRTHPYEPKRLVGPDVNYGRELLTALARRTGGWIGWEATSLRHIAGELAFVPLHAAHLRVGGDIEIALLVNHAFDRVIASRLVSSEFALLGRSPGFRTALRNVVLELRIGGVTPDALQAATVAGSPAREVVAVMRMYELLLREAGAADTAGVFRSALDNFDAEARYCLDGELLLAPTLVEHGLPGQLLKRLIANGARTLDGDVQLDPDAVAVDMFAAETPSEELREVIRRVAGEGRRWDEVEIVATDFDAYSVAMESLCQQLGVGGTMLNGIPLARTRLGRALERWFTWLSDGLPADLLRQALEAGELGAGLDAEPIELARELRNLRIGWGRARYESAVRQLRESADVLRVSVGDAVGGDAAGGDAAGGDADSSGYDARGERVASRQRTAAALCVLLETLLAVVPGVPERGSDAVVTVSVSRLATATLAWLAMVPLHGAPESQTADRVRRRLTALIDLDHDEVPFGSALASLHDSLSDVRAWPLLASESAPRSAAGGMLHLTNVEHAGTTGRSRVFVVGLSADSTAGSRRQDPLIPDLVRSALANDALSTTTQRRDEDGLKLSAGLASLRGHVTLSYATGVSLDGGDSGLAPVLLQIHRLLEHDGTLSYEHLRGSLGTRVSAVPACSTTARCVDARDVWLDTLTDGALLLDGEALVRGCFPSLDAGVRAAAVARSSTLSPHTGLVRAAAGVLGPRARPDRPVSPSSLETLAKCPLAWFYDYGLDLHAPDDPAYDPDAWLNAMQRGDLLHEVFETFTRQFADKFAGQDARLRDALRSELADAAMATIVDEAIARWVSLVPQPGDVVFAGEVEELKSAAASFLEMERQALRDGDDGQWRYFEYDFGSAARKGNYKLTDGTSFRVRGRVDRIDALHDGSWRVIDYKSGGASYFRKTPRLGPFNGGRRLQPAIYSSVVADLLQGDVMRFEYRFPTANGQNEIVVYTAAELTAAHPIVTQLLEHTRDGTFIPTTDDADCKYCEARAICRVEENGYGKLVSPRAIWAARNAEALEAYRGMLARRTKQATTKDESVKEARS